VPDNRMNNPNSSPDTKSARVTLKLKAGPRKSPGEIKTPPSPQPSSSQQAHPQPTNSQPKNPPPTRAGKPKPGAHWSDEYKERMQAEMDALVR
jgi:hypothetical protein